MDKPSVLQIIPKTHLLLVLLAAQAAAGGYKDLADLPVEQLDEKERMNCDRWEA